MKKKIIIPSVNEVISNDRIDYFYLLGILVSLFYLVTSLTNISEEQIKWLFYFLILFFCVALSFCKILHKKKFNIKASYFFSFVAALYLIFIHPNLLIINLIILINSIFFVYYFDKLKFSFDYKYFINCFYFLLIFIVALKIYYWVDFNDYLWRDSKNDQLWQNRFEFIVSNFKIFYNFFPILFQNKTSTISYFNFFYLIFFLSLFIIFNYCIIKSKFNNYINNFLKLFWWVIPSLIFFVESFSTYTFFTKGGGTLLHWQVYISTLELMKNGGYLLWDTPSQYGFLSLITIFIMPFENSWMKLYITNSVLNLIAGLLIFRSIWNRGNIFWYVCALLLTWSLWYAFLGGPLFMNASQAPSGGALRYFWVILLSYLIIFLRNKKFDYQIVFIFPVWLIGFFWSIISAFCVSFILIPYLFYYFFIDITSKRKILIYILIFPLSIFSICILIAYYYYNTIHHIPDFFAFFEYAINFSSGSYEINAKRVATALNTKGTILLPLFLLSWMVIEIFKIKDYKKKFLSLSLLFGFWSVGSYTVAWGFNYVYLSQAVFYIFFISLFIQLSENKIFHINNLSPIYIIIVLFCFSNPYMFKHITNTLKNQNYNLGKISFEEIDDYHSILTTINPKEIPIAYMEPGRYRLFNVKNHYTNQLNNNKTKIKRNYFPLFFASSNLIPLSETRRLIYGQRWLERNNFSKGWFINSINEHWHKPYEDLTKRILDDYHIENTIYKGDLKAVLYEKN